MEGFPGLYDLNDMYHIKRGGKATIGRVSGLWKKIRVHPVMASEAKQSICPRREWIVSLDRDAA
jgi:hypothetical protein